MTFRPNALLFKYIKFIHKNKVLLVSDENSKPRILAVDDSRVMRVAMRKILGKDYDVIEAEHGEDAWTLLINDSSIQVVFTDLSMPYLDGYGLLGRMRNSDDAHIKNMPVVIITGKEDDDAAKQQALDRGASDFISKPFESVQLLARAKTHVSFQQTSTKLTTTEDKLERQAAVDEITGLAGQKYFCKAADEHLAYVMRHGGTYIIVRMDIDQFDKIFIKCGKQAADAILKTIGHHMITSSRKEDMVARIGLAKFAMLLRNTSMTDAKNIVKRIVADISPLRFKACDNSEIGLTLSFGLYEPDIQTETEFSLQLANTEEYLQQAAKQTGNHYVAYSAKTKIDLDQINLESALEFLRKNEAAALENQLPALVEKLLPLLEYAAQQHGEQAMDLVNQIKAKLLS